MEDNNRLMSVVNTRGRVMWVHLWEWENLKAQGCRKIVEPKESYYPQYDQTIQQIRRTDSTINDTVEEQDRLEVEYV